MTNPNLYIKHHQERNGSTAILWNNWASTLLIYLFNFLLNDYNCNFIPLSFKTKKSKLKRNAFPEDGRKELRCWKNPLITSKVNHLKIKGKHNYYRTVKEKQKPPHFLQQKKIPIEIGKWTFWVKYAHSFWVRTAM